MRLNREAGLIAHRLTRQQGLWDTAGYELISVGAVSVGEQPSACKRVGGPLLHILYTFYHHSHMGQRKVLPCPWASPFSP